MAATQDGTAAHPQPVDTNSRPVSLPAPARRGLLRSSLVVGDSAALALAPLIALVTYLDVQSPPRAGLVVGSNVVVGLLVLRSQDLFLARVSSIRVLEAARLTRSAAILGFVQFGVDRLLGLHVPAWETVATACLSLLLLLVSRSMYRAWVGWARQSGRFIRRVVIVGADDEAVRMHRLFQVHKEVGIEVVGIFGDRSQAIRRGIGPLWRGPVSDTGMVAASLGAVGVVVCPGALMSHELNSLIRTLHAQNIHVHLGLGLSGVDTRRLQSLPLAYEPLLYCEPLSVSRLHVAAKRVFDIVGSAIAIAIASPIMLAIAIMIRLDDGRPVFFKQERVGRNGTTFKVIKFRTMHIDAEARLRELQQNNERNGPLFKMERDPRVTRIGGFLRSSSLDELPQLFNVIKGEMSLIGPRPALPSEVESFSDEVRLRERVRPGITGLWQVEARDNPSFDAYQRLDAYYLENWSILLDLVIVLGTIEQVTMRFISTVLKGRRDDAPPQEAAAEITELGVVRSVTGPDGAPSTEIVRTVRRTTGRRTVVDQLHAGELVGTTGERGRDEHDTPGS